MTEEILEQIKREVIIESNKIRTNPKSYIPILERYLENFDGNILARPEKDECIETQEGPAAYKEAIEFLKNQRPIKEIEYDEEASKVAAEYAKILSKGEVDTGEDESHIEERVDKYLDYDYAISECIDYGGSTGIDVIVNLLVDDGVQSRTHRDNLFNTKYGYYGVAVGPHPEYEYCTVIDYFGDIVSYKDKAKDKLFQEKKEKKQLESGCKIYFPMTKKGLPNLSNKKGLSVIKNKNEDIENQEIGNDKGGDKNSEYEEYDEINNSENPFKDDPDVPEGCIKRKTKYHKKILPQKTMINTVKIYLLEDGSEETVTIDEIIFDD